MGVLSLLLPLSLLAGGPAAAAPVEVRVISRAESPWLTAVLALPAPGVSPEVRALLASVYEVPEVYAGGGDPGPLRAHLEAGRRFSARPVPGGILVVVEGPADETRETLALLARVGGPLAITEPSVARAQGRVLRRKASGERSTSTADLLIWRAWYGDDAPPQRLVVDDIALHRTPAARVQEAHDALREAPGRLLLVEGRAPPDALLAPFLQAAPGGGPAAQPAPSPTPAPSLQPGPAITEVAAGSEPTLLLAAHPLPPAEGSPEIDALVEVSLEAGNAATSAGAAFPVDARVVRVDGAALLVLRAPLPAEGPQRGLELLQGRLQEARGLLTDPRALRALQPRAAARVAMGHATAGLAARAAGEAWLRGPPPAPVPPGAAAQWLIPEALRAVALTAR